MYQSELSGGMTFPRYMVMWTSFKQLHLTDYGKLKTQSHINNFMPDKTPKEEEQEKQPFIGPEPLPDFDDEGEEVESSTVE